MIFEIQALQYSKILAEGIIIIAIIIKLENVGALFLGTFFFGTYTGQLVSKVP